MPQTCMREGNNQIIKIVLRENIKNNSNLLLFIILVIEETLVIKVIGEPVLKLNTGILKCQVPSSMKHQVQIVSWKFGNNYIYPTKTWAKGK